MFGWAGGWEILVAKKLGRVPRHRWVCSTYFCQLFGVTDDTSKYVNLSDGYHFENLGLYELVRRQCKYILVSDVGADAAFGGEDLGNAVRKCRSDFGVEIDLDTTPLRPAADSGFSESHLVTGTVQYPNRQLGQIIYIKSTLTGTEPQDILAYKIANPVFLIRVPEISGLMNHSSRATEHWEDSRSKQP